MRKEFKFRVFHPEMNKFVFFDLEGFDYSDRYLDQKDYPVQQYTGYLDGKSNPIYEGDIVKSIPCPLIFIEEVKYTHGEIKWINGKFCVTQKNIGLADLCEFSIGYIAAGGEDVASGLEVIGNIIQPP